MTTIRAALVAATVTWAGLLVVTPLLASWPHASPIASALILAVYGIGSLVCHQLPERSYHMWTAQMPVCARCAGIYFGAVAGAIAAWFRTGTAGTRARLLAARGATPSAFERRCIPAGGVAPPSNIPDILGRRALPAGRLAVLGATMELHHGLLGPRMILALAVTPTLVTLVYEWTTGDMPAHAIRAAAGVPIGGVVAWLVVAAADNQVN